MKIRAILETETMDSNLTKSLPLPQLYLHILFIILTFVVRNKIYYSF